MAPPSCHNAFYVFLCCRRYIYNDIYINIPGSCEVMSRSSEKPLIFVHHMNPGQPLNQVFLPNSSLMPFYTFPFPSTPVPLGLPVPLSLSPFLLLSQFFTLSCVFALYLKRALLDTHTHTHTHTPKEGIIRHTHTHTHSIVLIEPYIQRMAILHTFLTAS